MEKRLLVKQMTGLFQPRDDRGIGGEDLLASQPLFSSLDKVQMDRLALGREPFSELVRQARVARASQLLLGEPGRLLASISAECGFSGPAQLHRAFRRVTGTTPAAYRRSELP